jgi:two-component system OmpR family response regulator
MRLLVVEDAEDLATTLRKALTEAGYAVDIASTGDEGLFLIREIAYDAVILDVMLPGRDGWSVLEAARAAGVGTPVLLLTARDEISDRVRGLDLGADDYLTKPFAVFELIARLRAIIRRGYGSAITTITIGDLVVNTAARAVSKAGTTIDLTAREFAILEILARLRGSIVTRSAICRHVYDDQTDVFSNTIDVHVASLRRKLGSEIIRTRRGEGYILDA